MCGEVYIYLVKTLLTLIALTHHRTHLWVINCHLAADPIASDPTNHYPPPNVDPFAGCFRTIRLSHAFNGVWQSPLPACKQAISAKQSSECQLRSDKSGTKPQFLH